MKPVYYKKGEKPSPTKCDKCGAKCWCKWIMPGHGWLCYECKCEVAPPGKGSKDVTRSDR